jgi:hypothetical protein
VPANAADAKPVSATPTRAALRIDFIRIPPMERPMQGQKYQLILEMIEGQA